MQEERSSQQFVSPDAISEDVEVLPVQLPVSRCIKLREEEDRCGNIIDDTAVRKMLNRLLSFAAEATMIFAPEPPGGRPPVPPSREEGEGHSRRDRPVRNPEDFDRSGA